VDHHHTGHLRWKALTWCADSDIPEVRTLARTIDRWRPEIAAFIATGYSNAKSEGINHMIKLAPRAAHGFRNPVNQRLRTRRVTTRRARGHLNPTYIRRPQWSSVGRRAGRCRPGPPGGLPLEIANHHKPDSQSPPDRTATAPPKPRSIL
jgi:hypothetical protein